MPAQPLMSQTPQWNPLKVFNIHQIKEFASILNSPLKELKVDSMLHISAAVMAPCSRDAIRLVSCWEWDVATGGRWGRQGSRRGTVGHLGFSTSAAWRGLRAQTDPKRMLTHIRCHGWHFTSLICPTGNPHWVCVCLTCMYYVCHVLCTHVCPLKQEDKLINRQIYSRQDTRWSRLQFFDNELIIQVVCRVKRSLFTALGYLKCHLWSVMAFLLSSGNLFQLFMLLFWKQHKGNIEYAYMHVVFLRYSLDSQ